MSYAHPFEKTRKQSFSLGLIALSSCEAVFTDVVSFQRGDSFIKPDSRNSLAIPPLVNVLLGEAVSKGELYQHLYEQGRECLKGSVKDT